MDFRPLDPARAPAWTRLGLSLADPVAGLGRAVWRMSPLSRSTWHDSHVWRCTWALTRAFAQVPRSRPTPRVVRLGPHTRMELDLSRLTDVLAYIYGVGENEVGWLCKELCPRDGVVADIGGNIGTTALAFAEHVREGGTVHVFEPSGDMLAALRRNIELSRADNIRIHPVGLADASQTAELTVAIEGNPGSAFLATPEAAGGASRADRGSEHRGDDRPGGRIEVRTLDEVLADTDRLDFVKIDVEGLETRVLRGARSLLERFHPVVVCEINADALARGGTSGREVCDLLTDLGYRLYYADRGRLKPYDVDAMVDAKLHNVVARVD